MKSSQPLRVDIISPYIHLFQHHVPAGFIFCDEVFKEAGLRDEMSLRGDAARMQRWLERLARRYRRRLQVRFVDLWSLPGLYLALRYRIREYPAFIIAGWGVFTGWDEEGLEEVLDGLLSG